MEQGASSAALCKIKLAEFSNYFEKISEHMVQLLHSIRIQLDSISHLNVETGIVSVGMPTDIPCQCHWAEEILQAKNTVESSLEYYQSPPVVASIHTDQTSLFLQWLHEIFTLQQLFSKQNSEFKETDASQETIELHEIQTQIELAIHHVDRLYIEIYEPFYFTFTRAKGLATKLLYPNCDYFQSLTHLELNQLPQMQQTLNNLKISILEKYALIVNKQPLSVIMKQAMKPQYGLQRKPKATSTAISVNLLGFGHMSNDSPVSIKIGLITEDTANKIVESNNNLFQVPINYAANIYSCVKSTIDEPPQPNITINMRKLETANAPGVYEANISNISIVNLFGRNKAVRVTSAKYYFIITADFFYEDTWRTAWTMSNPVMVTTYSGQVPGALATISWAKYFSKTTWISGPAPLREEASVNEILNILKLHFMEWTVYKNENVQEVSLTLDKLQLQCLAERFMDQFCKHGNCSRVKRCNWCRERQTIIPLQSFYCGNLAGHDFSFWLWFYKAVLVLKRKYIMGLWLKSYIQGFIGETEAGELLKGCRVGDFLLIFSEHFEGRLSIVFVDLDGCVKVYLMKIDQTSSKSLKTTFLENIYKRSSTSQERFLTLFPDISKDIAFPRLPTVENARERNDQTTHGTLEYIFDSD